MKSKLIVILITILSYNCYSQISFEKGYYIDNSNQKTNCLIKNIDWKNNPTEFTYKLSENNKPQKATIESIKEFGIDNISKYVRKIVNIDRSKENIGYISENKEPIFNEEELFLKVLIEGKSNLYEYADGDLKRYFYNTEYSNIEQLIYKSYKTNDDKIGKNNRYKQQLWNNLKCPDLKISEIEKLSYRKKNLISFFIAYNNCNNQQYTNFEKRKKRDLLNLSIRPRLNSSSLTIQNAIVESKNADFGNKQSFGIGIELEAILPFNRNKWSLAIEPTYQSFKTENTTNVNDFFGGTRTGNVDYSSIEVPFSLRHYFFLNKDSKIFVNASFILDVVLDSSIDFTRSTNLTLNNYSIDIYRNTNLAFGIGYKHNDKYSIEIRTQTSREILSNTDVWFSNYRTLSIIFGYSIF